MPRNMSGPTIAIVLACALAACDERIAAPAEQAATSLETAAALGAAPAARSMIVFDSNRGGNRDLWAMAPDGSGLRWLAFHRRVTALNAEVHIVRADGLTQAVRLTEEPGFDGFVDWTRRLGR
ncbi:MAG: hypothetical protein WEB88_12790 [Gemmatimonadota bacterium]